MNICTQQNSYLMYTLPIHSVQTFHVPMAAFHNSCTGETQFEIANKNLACLEFEEEPLGHRFALPMNMMPFGLANPKAVPREYRNFRRDNAESKYTSSSAGRGATPHSLIKNMVIMWNLLHFNTDASNFDRANKNEDEGLM